THIITAQARNVLRVPLPAIRFIPAEIAKHRAEMREKREAGKAEGGRPEGAGEDRPRRGPPGARVWVLKDEKLTPVPVKVGLDDGTLVEVSGEGLQPGDKVVVSEQHDSETASASTTRRTGQNQQRRPQIPGGGPRF
ncbi:MAG TPA: hypothetical protein VKP60_14420, partial [Magnetospirillaceae bacterium]|nr:hypothetical protein [Magnetospirillaceae bacterium]